MGWGKKLVRILLLALTIWFLAPLNVQSDEVLPWPWGSECPFPWSDIQGQWTMSEFEGRGVMSDYFQFIVIGSSSDGTHYFQIKRFDPLGNLVATGKGFGVQETRIVRAAMTDVNPSAASSQSGTARYWAIVRGYESDQSSSSHVCRNDLTVVVTLRPIGSLSMDEDVHYIVQKIEPLKSLLRY